MPDVTTLTADECDALAQGLRTAADAARDQRKSHAEPLSKDYEELQAQEDRLRDLADQMTALAIERDTVLPDLSCAHLQSAIDAANGTLVGIAKAKAAIGVLGGLIDFGTAVLSKKPKAIWNAARDLKERIDAAA